LDTSRTLVVFELEEINGNNSVDHLDFVVGRRTPDVAVQQRLGILSQRRLGPGFCNPADSRINGPNLVGTRPQHLLKTGEYAMNWDQAKGKWKQMKGGVKTQWGKLTDDDLDVISGQKDVLVGKIQERYGIAKDEAAKQVDSWQPSDYDNETTEREVVVRERKAS
jgi:uncharacterized protein YjbJ (UPF0337 family)